MIVALLASLSLAVTPARQCKVKREPGIPCAYSIVSRESGIPARILYAIALQESRIALGNGRRQPWPWTLNVAGTGYRYGSRKAAFGALQSLLARGERRVDVGLMQVHYRFHDARLGTAWTALHPMHNLRVGAAVLQDCFIKHGDWPGAIGCYHSGTPWRAAAYRTGVNTHIASLK